MNWKPRTPSIRFNNNELSVKANIKIEEKHEVAIIIDLSKWSFFAFDENIVKSDATPITPNIVAVQKNRNKVIP